MGNRALKDGEPQATADHYHRLLRRHGPTHQALNWGSAEGQRLRFSVLADIADLRERRILDVGCGLGDFASWLEAAGLPVTYTGIDITPSLIDAARQRRPADEFVCGDILDPTVLEGRTFDYVFASGIFATYRADGEARMPEIVARMWQLAAEGIAFNSLSSWAPDPDPEEFHADPARVLGIVRALSPCVRFRHDYHRRDFTFYVLRNPGQ